MDKEQVSELVAKADRLYAQAKIDEARAAYEEVLAADPSEAWAYSRIGAILAQLGDVQGAEEALEKAIELKPNLSQAHSNLGNLYYARGEYDRALTKYKEAIALNPDNPVFHENLHAAYKKLGKLSEAVRALKQANRLERQETQANAKAQFAEVKAKVKRGKGCLGTALLVLLLTSAVLVNVL